MPKICNFQHDNDPNHTSRAVESFCWSLPSTFDEFAVNVSKCHPEEGLFNKILQMNMIISK